LHIDGWCEHAPEPLVDGQDASISRLDVTDLSVTRKVDPLKTISSNSRCCCSLRYKMGDQRKHLVQSVFQGNPAELWLNELEPDP